MRRPAVEATSCSACENELRSASDFSESTATSGLNVTNWSFHKGCNVAIVLLRELD